MRELAVLSLIVGVGAGYWLRDEKKAASEPIHDPQIQYVWTGEKPHGLTWAKLGPLGRIEVEPNAGYEGKGAALRISMDGIGYRGCGLNWKGWFPEDACTDASRFNALTFYLRQVGNVSGIDLGVELIDNVKRNDSQIPSNQLSVISDGGLRKLTSEWQKVILPLDRFVQNRPLQIKRLWGINFVNQGESKVTFQIDRIAFANEKVKTPKFPESAGFQAFVKLDKSRKPHPISEGIYGVCELPKEKLAEYGIPITRWGGNTSSRYNWKLNADNGASDWYFKNRGTPMRSLTDNAYLQTILRNQSLNATSYQTIPMLGWVAKDFKSYSFSVSQHGKQEASEPGNEDIGNGKRHDGRLMVNLEPQRTSTPAPPEFIEEAVQHVVKHAGPATQNGVKYWVLDNEPMLWNKTHRDVHPLPLTYDALWSRTEQYASAIKKADPTAKVAGFCSWGWTDLFCSAADEGQDQYATQADHRAHGSIPIAEWYLQQCAKAKKQRSESLVDVFDIHWYPQAQVKGKTPYEAKGMDRELNELRLRTTRDLWDPNYIQESWIRNAVGGGKPTQVLRRVREWIDKHNPGMELCLGEYNFGGADNITGGLAQADVFGILAQERADLAFIWSSPEGSQNAAWQLFRSYDGKGSRFGDWWMPMESSSRDLTVHAARRERDGAITLVVINKNLGGECELRLDLELRGEMKVWRFDQTTGNQVIEIPEEGKRIDGSFSMIVPAASATMVVIR